MRQDRASAQRGSSGAAVADRYNVLPPGAVLGASQLQHQGLVERGDAGELELSRLFTARNLTSLINLPRLVIEYGPIPAASARVGTPRRLAG
jgi:hypothetical protein